MGRGGLWGGMERASVGIAMTVGGCGQRRWPGSGEGERGRRKGKKEGDDVEKKTT